jgi:hypothetical protein
MLSPLRRRTTKTDTGWCSPRRRRSICTTPSTLRCTRRARRSASAVIAIRRRGAGRPAQARFRGRRRPARHPLPVHGGLIPARGETTSMTRMSTRPRRAHPRTRGDDERAQGEASKSYGSSPHAGRRLPVAARPRPDRRLIPARGETTPASTGPAPARAAHPRTRGDDTVAGRSSSHPRGSSPHAGRRLHLAGHALVDPRLIPARGETTLTDQRRYASEPRSTFTPARPPAPIRPAVP